MLKKYHKKMLSRLFVFLLPLSFSVVIYGLLHFVAHAATDYTPLAPLPGTLSGDTTSLKDYLPGIFKLAIGIAGVLAVIQIIIGGLQYMSTDAIGNKNAGRERITAAIGGLLLALGAYIILNTISPNFVNLNINIKPVNVETVAPPPQCGRPGDPPCPSGSTCTNGQCVPLKESCEVCSLSTECQSNSCLVRPKTVCKGFPNKTCK